MLLKRFRLGTIDSVGTKYYIEESIGEITITFHIDPDNFVLGGMQIMSSNIKDVKQHDTG